MLESERVSASHGVVRSRSSRVAPSLNLYQPPAARAAELKPTQSSPADQLNRPTRPRDNSKDDRRSKRPDQQRYIPRPLRSEIGNLPAQKSESLTGDTIRRKISPEASSKTSSRTRYSETGTASSRLPLIKTEEQSTADSREICSKVDNCCTKSDKVSEKPSSRPILIRKRYSAPVTCLKSASSSEENSVEGINSKEAESDKIDNIESLSPQILNSSVTDVVKKGFKDDENSKDDSNISQVSTDIRENGESSSNFETDSNSMTEENSNQGSLSNSVSSDDRLKSDSIATNSGSDSNDIDCNKMEVDTSDQCEQIVPNVNIHSDSQIGSIIEGTTASCESPENDSKPVGDQESQVVESHCLSPSSENISAESLSTAKHSDENHLPGYKLNTVVQQDNVQTAKRIKTEECDDWETLYNDESELVDPVIIEELGDSVGKVKITTASSDYRSYQSVEERSNNGECIVEIYGFPAEFKTRDLMTAFAAYRNKAGFNIKWVDDTHALAVFNSPLVADEVLTCELPFVKTRPLRMALPESRAKARNLILPPAVRPKTCPALAKRLVSGALGLRLQTDKKARENEKMILKEARDQRRLAAKLKEAAWEGTLTSNMQS